MEQPTKRDLIETLNSAERRIAAMVGRWHADIPPWTRAELIKVLEPILDVLIQAGRRGQSSGYREDRSSGLLGCEALKPAPVQRWLVD